jgi:hypothetical protein
MEGRGQRLQGWELKRGAKPVPGRSLSAWTRLMAWASLQDALRRVCRPRQVPIHISGVAARVCQTELFSALVPHTPGWSGSLAVRGDGLKLAGARRPGCRRLNESQPEWQARGFPPPPNDSVTPGAVAAPRPPQPSVRGSVLTVEGGRAQLANRRAGIVVA